MLLQIGKSTANDNSEERPVQPDHALGRVLPRRWAARRQGRRRARGQQRPRADRPHLGLARRSRRRGLHRTPSAGTPTSAVTASIVNGDDVTATGLFVEHFQQYNTVWNGERGMTILYQNELPYDPPTQADWMHDGVEGWAGYKVGDHVQHAHALRRRRLRLQPEQPIDPHRERLRGPANPRRPATPRHDGQPRRRHDRPRGQRGGRPGGHESRSASRSMSSTIRSAGG